MISTNRVSRNKDLGHFNRTIGSRHFRHKQAHAQSPRWLVKDPPGTNINPRGDWLIINKHQYKGSPDWISKEQCDDARTDLRSPAKKSGQRMELWGTPARKKVVGKAPYRGVPMIPVDRDRGMNRVGLAYLYWLGSIGSLWLTTIDETVMIIEVSSLDDWLLLRVIGDSIVAIQWCTFR